MSKAEQRRNQKLNTARQSRQASDRPEPLNPGTTQERNLRSRVAELEAENITLRVRLGDSDPLHGLPTNLNRLSDRFIRTLHALADAADPLRSSPLEAQRSYKRADSTGDEGASTRWARDLLRRIDNNLTPLLNEYDGRVDGTFRPRPKAEQVRCVNDKCGRYGKRVPRWIGPNGEIEIRHCDECGNKLARA